MFVGANKLTELDEKTDEPTAHLDEENKHRIRDLLALFQREVGCGLIICSHEPALFSASEHVLTLHDGILTERR